MSSSTYRYGFNGKENDNEVKGTGNQQDYGMRIYDPRLGRFLSLDPLTKDYPELTPYQFASNRPIDGIDLDGQEFLSYNKSMYRMQSYISRTNENDIVNVVYENIPASLQDSKTKSFKYVSGGPVTTMGRDYKQLELSGILYEREKYFKTGPKFYGLADGGQDPESTGSTSGMGGAAVNQARNNAANGAAGALGEEGAGVVANQWNAYAPKKRGGQKWGALSDEVQLRQGFYDATNLVNYQIENNLIGNKNLIYGGGRAALINFISDGYLPVDGGD